MMPTMKKKSEPANNTKSEIKSSEPIGPSKKIYQEANKNLGNLLLKGWTMLSDHCEGNINNYKNV